MNITATEIAQMVQILVSTGLSVYEVAQKLGESGVTDVPSDDELKAISERINAITLKSSE